MTLSFTIRKRHAIAIATLVALVAGAAWAAIVFRLPGSGTSTAVAVAWDLGSAPVSNDSGTLGDPTSFGSTPTRTAHLGTTEVVFAGPKLSITSTSVYGGYSATVRAISANTDPSLKVQGVELISTGATPFTPGVELQAFINPENCGASPSGLNTAFGLKWNTPGAYAFDVNVLVVPGSDYVAATCTAQAWTP